MKKTLTAAVILILLAASGYFPYQKLFEITPSSVSQIGIRDLESDAMQTYGLDASSAAKLFDGLSGTSLKKLPDKPYHTFELTLRNKWKISRSYTVYFDDMHSVYIQDMKTKRLTAVGSPAFFYSHEGFDSLYPYREPPRIEWTTTSGAINLQSEDKAWSYRKWDGSWHSVKRTSGSDGSNTVTSTDTIISFQPEYTPDAVRLEVHNAEGQVILQQEVADYSIPVMQEEGSYLYFVEVSWSKPENPYYGTCAYRFDLTVDLPASFEIPKTTATQGEMLKILVYNVNEDEKPVLEQNIFKMFRFFKNGNTYTGLLPTGYTTEPGVYEFRYGIEGRPLQKGSFTIQPRDFSIQHMVIDEKTNESTRNDAAYEEYDKYFTPVFLSSSDELYYSEPFVIPAPGRLSTEFGQTRYVNGSPTSYHHSGMDIATPAGTPIHAVNRGKVVLSMYLTLTGNTVVIDHGQGLFSVYYHMQEIMADKDSMVERGQQIGTIGSTGFSTGPHLHFTMSYFDRSIEPGYLLVGEPITYNNYNKYLK